MTNRLNLKEDTAGPSRPDIRGEDEKTAFFNQAAADHALQRRKLEMGFLGRALGGRDDAPNHIAFIAMLMGFLLAVSSLWVAHAANTADVKFWESFAERGLAFSGVCLSFIFGRSSAKG